MGATVVMFSGGIGSYAAARRHADQHGTEGMTLLFTDVSGSNPSEHVGEDPDTLRFVHDAAADIGAPLVILNDPRDIYQVFAEKKWLGNSQLAHCSWELKTKPARDWMDANASGATVIVGIDWTELERLPAIVKNWLPHLLLAPLTEPPYRDKQQLIRDAKQRGLTPPRMYELGFAHANCRGCVKAGQTHWRRLLHTFPDTYAYHEQQEAQIRDQLGDVAILRDRTGGTPVPLTLTEFRKRQDSMQIDLFDEGGCGCFTA
jgi:hypothetical protein